MFRRARSIIFIEHNNKAENHNPQGEVTTDEQNRQKEQSNNNQIIKYKHIKCVVQMEKVWVSVIVFQMKNLPPTEVNRINFNLFTLICHQSFGKFNLKGYFKLWNKNEICWKCAPRLKTETDSGEEDVIVKLLNQPFKLEKNKNIHSIALGWSQECFETDI